MACKKGMRKHTWFLASVCLVTVCLFGCGSGNVPVYAAKGRVVFSDGTPVGAGRVEFRPLEAPRPVVARGEVQADGTFELSTFEPGDGAIAGRHTAIVLPKMIMQNRNVVPAVKIDSRFGNYKTSGLEFTVNENPAKNVYTITVEPPGK